MSRPLFPPRGGDLRLPAVFEPNVSHPMIDDFSLRAHRQRTRAQPPGVTMQYELPLRNHPMWSGNNELGRECEFAADANNRQMVLKMDEWGPPQQWSVHLGITFTPTNTGPSPPFNQFFGVTALASFGSGGAVQEVELDWLNGNSFSASFNAISITAIFQNSQNVPSDLRLRATIGIGTVSRAPTRTIVINELLGPGDEGVAIIPKFASRYWVVAGSTAPTGDNPLYTNNVKVSQLTQEASAGRLVTHYGQELLAFPGPIPIVPGAQVVSVQNNGAADIPNPTVVFELAF